MKIRNSNFELLRIVSMFLIVLYHVILHGNTVGNCTNDIIKVFLTLIMYISIIHVNSFVLLTGYFQSKSTFKKNKLISLILQALFYMIVIIVVLESLGIITLSNLKILKEVLFLDVNSYWFIKTYVFLYLLSPFLNILIKNLKQKDYKKLLIILTVIVSVLPYVTGHQLFDNNGYTLYSFVYLYLLGAYLREYPVLKKVSMKKSTLRIVLLSIFFGCAILNYAITSLSQHFINVNSLFTEIANNLNYVKFDYSNTIVIVQTIAYFLFFETLNIKSNIINFVSKLTFGIYLIHDNVLIRTGLLLYKVLGVDNGPFSSYSFVIYIFVIAVLIFVVCAIIELARQKLFILVRDIFNKIKIKARS